MMTTTLLRDPDARGRDQGRPRPDRHRQHAGDGQDHRPDRRRLPGRRPARERRAGPLAAVAPSRSSPTSKKLNPLTRREERLRPADVLRGRQDHRQGRRRRRDRRARAVPASSTSWPRWSACRPRRCCRTCAKSDPGDRLARRRRLPGHRDHRLRLAAVPPREAAEDVQGGDQGGGEGPGLAAPRSSGAHPPPPDGSSPPAHDGRRPDRRRRRHQPDPLRGRARATTARSSRPRSSPRART